MGWLATAFWRGRLCHAIIKQYLCNTEVNDAMILYEEYNKDRYDEDDVFEKMPVPVFLAIIVLCSLAGILIVIGALYGL
jgi:hypothetical protein